MSTRAERKIRALVMARDSWTCQICGRPATDAGHISARHHGGEYTPQNLEAQCVQHNRGEGHTIAVSTAATPREWTY
jgi:5-methylcytosine-specific restriction endonuclease McrA